MVINVYSRFYVAHEKLIQGYTLLPAVKYDIFETFIIWYRQNSPRRFIMVIGLGPPKN